MTFAVRAAAVLGASWAFLLSSAGNVSEIGNTHSLSGKELDEALEEFNTWFAQKAGGGNKLKVKAAAINEEFHVGVIAQEDIPAEEIYVRVPHSVIMNHQSAVNSEVGPSLNEVRALFNEKVDQFHELLLHLWFEKYFLKEKSYWWPYIRLLPETEDLGSPYLCDSKTLEAALKGSALLVEIRKQQREMRQKFDHIVSQLLEKVPFFKHLSRHMSYEEWEWGTLILWSRGIVYGKVGVEPWAPKGEIHLIPMLDFVNERAVHPETNKPLRPHETSENVVHEAVARAPIAFAKGDQLFENFNQPNHVLFLNYGFFLEKNPDDCYRWDIGGQTHCFHPSEGCPDKDAKRIGNNDMAKGRQLLLGDLKNRLSRYPKGGAPDNANPRQASVYAFAAREKRLLKMVVDKVEQQVNDHKAQQATTTTTKAPRNEDDDEL